MKIGSIEILPLIDGEIAAPSETVYTNVSPEQWEENEHFLIDGCVVNTVGGFLIKAGDRLVVLDTGIGSKPVYPFIGGGFRSALLSTGFKPEDVTDVLFSHLHLDHIGWATQAGKAFFPNATYRCDKRDWDHFVSESYDMPEWEVALSNPAEDAALHRLSPVEDRMEFWVGDAEVLPGIVAIEASGHTPGSAVLELSSDGEKGLMIGDLVHSQPELFEDRWDFLNHSDHEAGMASIEKIRKLILDEDLPFAAAHFPGLRWGRLKTRNGKLSYEELPGPS